MDDTERDRLVRLETLFDSLSGELRELKDEDKEAQRNMMLAINQNAQQLEQLNALANRGKGAIAILLAGATLLGALATWIVDHMVGVIAK